MRPLFLVLLVTLPVPALASAVDQRLELVLGAEQGHDASLDWLGGRTRASAGVAYSHDIGELVEGVFVHAALAAGGQGAGELSLALQETRLGVGYQYALLPWLTGYAGVSGLVGSARLSFGERLHDRAWYGGGEARLGARAGGTTNNDSDWSRFGFVEAAYAQRGSPRFALERDSDGMGGVAVGVGRLGLSTWSVRVGGAIGF